MRKPGSTCRFSGCKEEVHAKGLCPGHHAQWYKGKELSPIQPKMTPDERFVRGFTASSDSDACWIWTGRTEKNRGRFWDGKRMVLAHVYAFERSGREYPSDGSREVDHYCQNSLCVNPAHLRLVPRTVNAQNKRLSNANTSGYKGVHLTRKTGRWTARVVNEGHRFYVGHYDTPQEAARAALLMRMELYKYPNKYDEELATEFGIGYPKDQKERSELARFLREVLDSAKRPKEEQ